MGAENDDNQNESNADGDFGEGTGSLEEQLLNSLPKEGEEDEGESDEEAGDEDTEGSEEGEGSARNVSKPQVRDAAGNAGRQAPASSQAVTPQTLFDANGKLALKDGSTLKVTPEIRQELERGQLRQADYTRKTQELSKVKNEAQEVLNAQAEIQKDARNLFNYFKPEQILSAFTRQEMLSHGLNAAGVKPQVWNQFLEWFKESGGDAAGAAALPQADLYTQQFQEYARRLDQLERQNMTREEKAKEADQQRAYEDQMSAYDKEVDGALKDFPAVKRKALLVEMASSDGSKTVRELAKALSDEKEAQFQEYLKTKTQQKKKTVKSPRGTSVPILPKRPMTFEDADDQIAKLYGDGTISGSAPFSR